MPELMLVTSRMIMQPTFGQADIVRIDAGRLWRSKSASPVLSTTATAGDTVHPGMCDLPLHQAG
jgi:hypothetical protein